MSETPEDAAADTGLRLLALPNGLEIACQSRMEAEHIYEDIFEKKIYLRNGLTLRDGACVFDVGGNIGLFTLFCHQKYRDVTTYTFEPAPPLFRILQHNTGLYATGAARLINAGVSAAPGQATLTFYPYSSGMSSFHADLGEEMDVLRVIMENQLQSGMQGMESIMASSSELLDARFTAETFNCELVTVSQVIDREAVEWIDFLKIDVQKCELEVLGGIEERHWPRIRQIAIEVHDLGGCLAEVTRLLEKKGFNVVTEQDPLLTGSVLYNLFAVSRAAYGGTAESGGVARPAEMRERPQSRAELQRVALQRQRRTVNARKDGE